MRLVDGTNLALPDTPQDQASLRQPKNQPDGLRFPICRPIVPHAGSAPVGWRSLRVEGNLRLKQQSPVGMVSVRKAEGIHLTHLSSRPDYGVRFSSP